MTTTAYRLKSLRPGSDIGIDSRLTGREIGIPDLARSIELRGVLQNPMVWLGEDDKPYVVFGNRRRLALLLLVEQGKRSLDDMVEVEVFRGTKAEALEASMAENRDRVALHPVDEYENFARLVRLGFTPADVGERFGLDQRVVLERLALGQLHPAVLQDWRSGDRLDEGAVQALAVLPDPGAQFEVYRQARAKFGERPLRRWEIKGVIAGGETGRLSRYLAYVGRDAYLAEGGALVQDLFEGDQDVVLDGAKLAALAELKLSGEAHHLRLAEGWGAVYHEFDEPDDISGYVKIGQPKLTAKEQKRYDLLAGDEHGMGHHDAWQEREALLEAARVRGLTAEDKAASCVRLVLSWDGKLIRHTGIAPAAAVEQRAPAATVGAPEASTGLPGRVTDELRSTLTLVLARAVADYPAAAMALLYASLVAGRDHGAPVHIDGRGAPGVGAVIGGAEERDSFADALGWWATANSDDRSLALAARIGMAVDASSAAHGHAKGVTRAGVEMAVALLGQSNFMARLRANFNAESYFDGVKKEQAVEAIEEALGPAVAKIFAGKKKGEVAAYAAQHVPATGWLPAEYRFGGYAHPYVASVDEPVAEPAPKAKKRREKTDG